MKRIIQTAIWTMIYAFVWIVLEVIIYGNVTDRLIDNIMMLLFIPMIYKAMGEPERRK